MRVTLGPSGLGVKPKPRAVVEIQAGDQVTVKWTLTSTASKDTIKDVLVHFYAVKIAKVGDPPPPKLAKDVLLEALSSYTGTVVFVSHDRYFIDKLATRVFEVGEGRVEIFPGNYEDYLWRKQGGAETLQKTVVAEAVAPPPPPSNDHQAAADLKRLNPIKLKQMKSRVKELESEISRLESAIASCETALQNYVNFDETQRQSRELETSRAKLQSSMAEWEELSQVLPE